MRKAEKFCAVAVDTAARKGSGGNRRPGKASGDKHTQRRTAGRAPPAAVNVGQVDTFGSLCAVIQDHSENAAVKETGIRQANKADDGSALRRIASTADTFDALTHHNNNGVHVVGLGDFNAAGRFGGGFIDAGSSSG